MLGTGSSAVVYRAHDPTGGTDVAVKLLTADLARDPHVRARFVSRARDLSRLSDDRLVRVRDVGEFEGRPYLVMELLEGGTLEDRLADRGTLDPDAIRRLADGLGAAIVVVHAAGFVHGDVKPSNVLIRRSGDREDLVLADFGFIHDLDRSADIAAASGVVGRAALGTDWQRVLVASGPHRVTALEPAGTEPLAYELRRGLSPDPAERHASISEWAAAVGDAASDHAAVIDMGEDGLPRRRPLVRIAAGALVVVAMLLAFATVTSPSASDDDPPPPPTAPG